MKMKNLYILTLCPLLILSACADIGASYQPILDGAPSASFQSDLQACQSLARGQPQLDQDTMGSAAAGGLLGAAIAEHDEGGTAVEGLVGGALIGLVEGVSTSKDKREMIVVDCMKGRGHPVVG
jgi:hypothetical protein